MGEGGRSAGKGEGYRRYRQKQWDEQAQILIRRTAWGECVRFFDLDGQEVRRRHTPRTAAVTARPGLTRLTLKKVRSLRWKREAHAKERGRRVEQSMHPRQRSGQSGSDSRVRPSCLLQGRKKGGPLGAVETRLARHVPAEGCLHVVFHRLLKLLFPLGCRFDRGRLLRLNVIPRARRIRLVVAAHCGSHRRPSHIGSGGPQRTGARRRVPIVVAVNAVNVDSNVEERHASW